MNGHNKFLTASEAMQNLAMLFVFGGYTYVGDGGCMI